jgi:hypothetical protein
MIKTREMDKHAEKVMENKWRGSQVKSYKMPIIISIPKLTDFNGIEKEADKS